jgi:hypothetical protein
MSELLPLFPLSTVLFPGMRLPLHIFEERYRQLVADLRARPEPRRFGVIAIRKGREVGADGVAALHDVGCVAEARQIVPHPDGRFDVATVGTDRFRLLRVDDSLPYFQGEIELLPEEALPAEALPGDAAGEATPSALAFATHRVQAGFRGYLNALADRGGGVISVAELPDEPLLLSYVVGAAMIIDLPERQSLLAAPTALDRLRLERSLLVREAAMFRATTSRPAPDFGFGQISQNLRRRRPGHAAHQVELVVRHGFSQVRQPVRHREERADRADVPDVVIGQAVRAQRAEDLVGDRPRLHRELDGDVKDGALAVVQFGVPPVGGHLIGDPGITGPDAGDRAVGHDAVQAVVLRAGGHHDQLPVALGERGCLLVHQRIVVGEERPPLGGPPGQGEEDVGDEAGLLRDFLDTGPQVLGHVLKRWHLEHAPSLSSRRSPRPGYLTG